MTEINITFNNRYSDFRESISKIDSQLMLNNITKLTQIQRNILGNTDFSKINLPNFTCDIKEFGKIEQVLSQEDEQGCLSFLKNIWLKIRNALNISSLSSTYIHSRDLYHNIRFQIEMTPVSKYPKISDK